LASSKRILINIADGYHLRFYTETNILKSIYRKGHHIDLLVPLSFYGDTDPSQNYYTKHAVPTIKIKLFEKLLITIYSGLFRKKNRCQSINFFYNRKKEIKTVKNNLKFLVRFTLEKHISSFLLEDISITFIKKLIFNFDPDEQTSKLLCKLKPHVVVSSTPGFKYQDLPVLRYSLKHGIPSICSVLSWDNLSSKGPMLSKIDRLLVWNKYMAQDAFDQHGLKDYQVEVLGAPQFDIYKYKVTKSESINLFPELKGYDKVLLIGCVPSNIFPSIIKIIIEVYKFLSDVPNLKTAIVIRPHPQQSLNVFYEIQNLPDVYINSSGYLDHTKLEEDIIPWHPGLNHMRSLMNILVRADLLITIASSLTLDALAAGTPVVNIGFDPDGEEQSKIVRQYYQTAHFAKILKSAMIPVAKSEDELKWYLTLLLKNKLNKCSSAINLVENICGTIDGKSAERHAEAIVNFANRL